MLKKLSFMVILMGYFVSFMAQAQLKYIDGVDYYTLENPVEKFEQPKITEFFWFGCPLCNSLRKPLDQWLKSGDIDGITFEFVPAVTGSRTWDIPAQSYYTMQALDLDLYHAYFDAVFVEKNYRLLGDENAIRDFFVEKGNVSPEQFDKAWKSLDVAQKLKRAARMFKDANLDGTPSFLVNGKYTVPVRGDFKRLFDILSTLARQQQ